MNAPWLQTLPPSREGKEVATIIAEGLSKTESFAALPVSALWLKLAARTEYRRCTGLMPVRENRVHRQPVVGQT